MSELHQFHHRLLLTSFPETRKPQRDWPKAGHYKCMASLLFSTAYCVVACFPLFSLFQCAHMQEWFLSCCWLGENRQGLVLGHFFIGAVCFVFIQRNYMIELMQFNSAECWTHALQVAGASEHVQRPYCSTKKHSTASCLHFHQGIASTWIL